MGGCGAYGLFYLLIGELRGGGPWLVPLFPSYGLFLSATEGVKEALVADLSESGRRGTACGWFHLVTGLTVLPASLLFGCLHEGFSPQLAFGAGGVLALLAAGRLAVLPLPDHRRRSGC